MGASILVAGNPVDGFRFIGPFEDQEDAVIYGDGVDDNWQAVELESPDEELPGAPEELAVPSDPSLWLLFGDESASEAELQLLVKHGKNLQKAFAYLLMERREREQAGRYGVSDLSQALRMLYAIRREDRFPVNGG